ncbi:MAG: ATPase [Lachnospiraceae bacterium]|nr:ATPase [Lachnospiraceae bacterium]
MTSRMEQMIDEIEEYIDGCKYQHFSSENIVVNRGELDQLLDNLKKKIPSEIREYQKIVHNKDAILADAKAKAEAIIAQAEIHTNELVSEHQIMQQAYAQANEVVMLATKQAQEILDNATTDANNIRTAAISYTGDMLGNMESILTASMETSKAKFDNYYNNLKNCLDIVQANKQELVPDEKPETPVNAEESKKDDETDAVDVTDLN